MTHYKEILDALGGHAIEVRDSLHIPSMRYFETWFSRGAAVHVSMVNSDSVVIRVIGSGLYEDNEDFISSGIIPISPTSLAPIPDVLAIGVNLSADRNTPITEFTSLYLWLGDIDFNDFPGCVDVLEGVIYIKRSELANAIQFIKNKLQVEGAASHDLFQI